jgi:capsular polysaccharide biosynthesis protein
VTTRDPRLEGEAEVDLGRHATAVAARWWLVALGLLAGVLVALLVSVGGKDVYRAAALVYPGQTLAPSGSAQVQSLATNPSTIREIVRSEAAVRRAANASGYLPPARLRRNTAVHAVQGNVARTGQVQLVNVVVTGDAPRRTAAAANALAKTAVDRISRGTDTKISALREQIAAGQKELEGIDTRVEAIQAELARPGLSSVEKLVVLTNLGLTEQRRTTVQVDVGTRQQLLAQAVDVERGRVVEPAVARKVTAQSRRNQLVVGGAVGLLLGLAAALAWEPAARRFRPPR